jgi:uncharacterized damage-inducible protein DinB
MLDRWNDIGNKLVAMAKDFPEDKYDFKVQKDQRTFAQNLLHAAALDFVLIRRISGSNVGPDFGEGDNPSRDVFKTKADVVKFVQEAVADGAKVIQQQGDAGLDNTSKFFGNRLAHNSSIWTFAIEHSGEHYGQLVVYYRANNLVPPDSRCSGRFFHTSGLRVVERLRGLALVGRRRSISKKNSRVSKTICLRGTNDQPGSASTTRLPIDTDDADPMARSNGGTGDPCCRQVRPC